MTPTLTTEAYIGMSIIMLALLIANVSAASMFKHPWRTSNIDKDYAQDTTGAFFIYLATGTAVIVSCFLGALVSMFAATPDHVLSKTYDLTQTQAATLFYIAGIGAFVFGALGALNISRDIKPKENSPLLPMAYISTAYVASGAIFALLTILLVSAGSSVSVKADYSTGAQFIVFGSMIGWFVNTSFRKWITTEFRKKTIDQQALTSTATKRALISIFLSCGPIVAGIFYIAS